MALGDLSRGVTLRRILLIVLAAGILHVASMLHATGGRVSLPVDDSFIYFRYAEQLAAGHPLVYQPGDAPTTGATSLPWVLLLSLGALLGFVGKSIVFWALPFGGLALALTAWWTAGAQRALTPAGPGSQRPGDLPLLGIPLAGALCLLSGPLQWGTWSGMEIPLTTAAVSGAFFALCRADGRPSRDVALALAALAIVRPEGAALAAVVLAFWAVNAVAGNVPRRALAWSVVPLLGILSVPLIDLALTGDLRSSGFLAKTRLAGPGADVWDAIRVAILRTASLASSHLLGMAPRADGLRLYAYESETAVLWVPPLAGCLWLIGVLPAVAREARERRGGAGMLAVAWTLGIFFAASLLEEPDAHCGRYLMPALPPFFVFVAIGTGRVVRALREAVAGLSRLGDGLRILLAAGGAASVLFFALAYGDHCEDIDKMQISVAEALRTSLPKEAVLAVNDAGALAYLSGRRTVDLIGLTTPGFAGLWRQGSGVLGEKLEAMPAGRRPDWFAIFPNWFEFEPAGVLHRAGSVRLTSPSIVDAEKVLYRADWSLAGSGDAPRSPAFVGPGVHVTDGVDVADPDAERAHDFHFTDREHGAAVTSFWRRAPVDGAGEILDGGRMIFGEARFELARDPLADAQLVVRAAGGARQSVFVQVDGGPLTRVDLEGKTAGEFHEQAIARIPAGTERAKIILRVVPPPGSGPLNFCYAFAVCGLP